jgi:hypothetical protein
MTHEMVTRARGNARKAAALNVEFRLGEIEHLPIALWPSKSKGEEHVFSGCAVTTPEGKLMLIYTSIAFALWHISAVTLTTEYRPTPSRVPIFLMNAAVIGIVLGNVALDVGINHCCQL